MKETFSKEELLETIMRNVIQLQREITQLKNMISHYKQMD